MTTATPVPDKPEDLEKTLLRLREVQLFSYLNREKLLALAGQMAEHRLEKDQVLFQQGDPGDAIYILRSGWVKVSTHDSQGQELVLNHCGPGEAIGDVALLDGAERTATVTALTPVNALVLCRADFLALLKHEPQVALDVIRGMTDKIRLSTVFIQKAIDWSAHIANGEYEQALQEMDAEHHTIVTHGHSDESRAGEFLAAFFRMARDVQARETQLRQQIEALELKISVDREKVERQVQELSGTEFFQKLRSAAGRLRRRSPSSPDEKE